MSNNILSIKTIRQIAAIAKIVIPDSELALYQKNLSALFALITQIQNVDTQNITPMTQPQITK